MLHDNVDVQNGLLFNVAVKNEPGLHLGFDLEEGLAIWGIQFSEMRNISVLTFMCMTFRDRKCYRTLSYF